jgi:hypothetical protein
MHMPWSQHENPRGLLTKRLGPFAAAQARVDDRSDPSCWLLLIKPNRHHRAHVVTLSMLLANSASQHAGSSVIHPSPSRHITSRHVHRCLHRGDIEACCNPLNVPLCPTISIAQVIGHTCQRIICTPVAPATACEMLITDPCCQSPMLQRTISGQSCWVACLPSASASAEEPGTILWSSLRRVDQTRFSLGSCLPKCLASMPGLWRASPLDSCR